ncbi:hypothetical protein [Vibrio vulnificus]|uniref:hypothetical protein n=1 Tax=Vibrio vulnificus TaxID=672 RepID=UPI001593976E|nr:hypothetical protein [Vibrio vulnificus]NVC72618.1 hypothetical protein [Vibrio vulnificus]
MSITKDIDRMLSNFDTVMGLQEDLGEDLDKLGRFLKKAEGALSTYASVTNTLQSQQEEIKRLEQENKVIKIHQRTINDEISNLHNDLDERNKYIKTLKRTITNLNKKVSEPEAYKPDTWLQDEQRAEGA